MLQKFASARITVPIPNTTKLNTQNRLIVIYLIIRYLPATFKSYLYDLPAEFNGIIDKSCIFP